MLDERDRKGRLARARAVRKLIAEHEDEYLALLVKERDTLGLATRAFLRPPTTKTRGQCGNLGHEVHCLCDIKLHRLTGPK